MSRKYGLVCSACHIHGAKLNSFGQVFRQQGAEFVGLKEERKGIPVTVWLSAVGANRALDPTTTDGFFSRLEIVSFDELLVGTRFMAEWFPVGWVLRTDGTRVDRSGRFESLWLRQDLSEDWSVQVGQFRPLELIDPSRRIAISEPFGLSSSLPGEPGGSARETALRVFSPTFRSPAARLSWRRCDDPENCLDTVEAHLSTFFPGEFSIPLSDKAQESADFQFESRAKGVFFEMIRQTSRWALSGFHFSGTEGRRATGAGATLDFAPVQIEAALWSGKSRMAPEQWRGTLDAVYSKSWASAFGLRLDGIEGERTWLVPYASFHTGGKEDAWRFAVEARLRKGAGTVFVVEVHFLR